MPANHQDDQQPPGIPFNDMPPDLNPGQVKTWLAQEQFLHAYAKLHTFSKAAKAIGAPFQSAYYWRLHNVLGFNDRLAVAIAIIADNVEGEAFRRIYNPDKFSGHDILQITMLNAWLPDRYKPAIVANDPAIKETLEALRAIKRKLRDHETKANQEQGYQEAPDAIEEAQDILTQRLPPRNQGSDST